MNWALFVDVLKNGLLITGLVTVMMLMIEFINVSSHGKWFERLKGAPNKQVFLGTLLGLIPGCVGGFAAVSLYTHRLIGFGALVAMMIASSGDEAFVMLTLIPKDALILFAVLFVIAITSGLLINFLARLGKGEKRIKTACEENFEVHLEDEGHFFEKPHFSIANLKHFSWRKIVLLLGLALFIVSLALGVLGHGHHEATQIINDTTSLEYAHKHSHGISLLDEYWINLLFAILSLGILAVIAVSGDHFIKEHLWDHVIRKHFLSIFLWTTGALLLVQLGLHYLNIESWTSDNIPLMIILAVLVGLIPESGPHLVFVALYASGLVPFSVLLASSISQDGHSSLPLLAETKKGFLKAKLVNMIIGLIVGFGTYLLNF
ncbi:MAG: arsenic efflux protein [Bacteroidales bacterium]|jgi:hypothetical protein|nr:arsenic efflux protein [Bacteroidales bacterium]